MQGPFRYKVTSQIELLLLHLSVSSSSCFISSSYSSSFFPSFLLFHSFGIVQPLAQGTVCRFLPCRLYEGVELTELLFRYHPTFGQNVDQKLKEWSVVIHQDTNKTRHDCSGKHRNQIYHTKLSRLLLFSWMSYLEVKMLELLTFKSTTIKTLTWSSLSKIANGKRHRSGHNEVIAASVKYKDQKIFSPKWGWKEGISLKKMMVIMMIKMKPVIDGDDYG